MSINSCNCKMKRYSKISYGILDNSTLNLFSCLYLIFADTRRYYTTRPYMIFAVIYAIKTSAKKKHEKISEFKFFRFLFHNYINCICNGEDCIIMSLLITAGQFLHNNFFPMVLQLGTGGDDRRIFQGSKSGIWYLLGCLKVSGLPKSNLVSFWVSF